jgi:hypothetical protein
LLLVLIHQLPSKSSAHTDIAEVVHYIAKMSHPNLELVAQEDMAASCGDTLSPLGHRLLTQCHQEFAYVLSQFKFSYMNWVNRRSNSIHKLLGIH